MEYTALKDLIMLLVDEDEESSGDDFLNALMESSDEEEILRKLLPITVPRKQRSKNKKYLDDSVLKYTEDEFKEQFKINRKGFEYLRKRLQCSEMYAFLRPDKKLSAAKYLAVFMRFAGDEKVSTSQISRAFDLSLSSVCRILNRVTNFVSELADDIIVWPDDTRKLEITEHFQTKFGIRGIIGAIGVTRIAIESVKGEYSEDYRNSEGQICVCLQGICDERGKFIDVFIGLPGSFEESTIFKNSFIYSDLDKLCKGYFLVGDSQYPCMKNLLTPYSDKCLTFAQKLYNRQLRQCKSVIDEAFKALRERFGELHRCKLKGVKKVCNFIRACCVAHNVAIDNAPDATETDQEMDNQISNDDLSDSEGKAARDAICEELIASNQQLM